MLISCAESASCPGQATLSGMLGFRRCNPRLCMLHVDSVSGCASEACVIARSNEFLQIPTNLPAARHASRWLYIFEASFPVTTIAIKLSILYLYKRAFTILNQTFAWSLYTSTALQIGWAATVSFTTIFQCWSMNTLGK